MTLHLKDTPFEMHWMSQHSFQHTLNSTWLFCQWPISLDVPRQAPCSKIPACLFAVLFDLLFLNQMRVNKPHFEKIPFAKKKKKKNHDPCWLIGALGIGAVNISVTSWEAPSSDTSGLYGAPVTCSLRWPSTFVCVHTWWLPQSCMHLVNKAEVKLKWSNRWVECICD